VPLAALIITLAATTIVVPAKDRIEFRGSTHVTTRLVPAFAPNFPADRCRDEPSRPPVVGLLLAQGAGDVDILGQIFDEQSHCVRADGSFFAGVFTFTNREGESIHGRYSGETVPTLNTQFPPEVPAPTGPFLVEGNVCVAGGTVGRVQNDCRAGRFFPARGMATVNADGTGSGVIFIHQTIDIDGRR
jgi:hypothetical protein